ncbi:MAG: acyltransferase [Candidatus Marinimicrobia bacterium]|nr:acyltransferase [Candidatus Neomarinimicrobiota bacterium]
MKLGIYQFDPEWGKKKHNLARIEEKLTNEDNVDLWILPELCTTGYQFTSQQELNKLAEKFPAGFTSNHLQNLSSYIKAGIIIGAAEKTEHGIYNSAAIYENGEYKGIYRKLHLYYEENKYFTPGEASPSVFEIKGVKVGVMICFDWIFPETARTLALKGAQLIAHPANLVLPYCPHAMLIRSIENKVFTATANRIGEEDRTGERLQFIGNSQITDVQGKRLGKLSRNEENILIVDINPEKALDKSINQYNDLLGDRRSKFYYNE